jgi:hypothetical protein
MFIPAVTTRIEQRGDSAGVRINAIGTIRFA